MIDKVKVPGGAFYAGDGLTVDPINRTVSGDVTTPDWNQNDATASDYIKNRPFYENSIVTYIVPESTVAFSDDNGQMVAAWPESFDAVEGQTYTISWDGTDYECEPTKLYGATFIGNLAVVGTGTDTGEPFLFMFQNQWTVASSDSASEHVISIKIVTPQIVQIDKKYLPSAKKFVVDATNLPSDNTGWGKLYNSLNAAYNAGDEILLDANGTGETLLKLTNVYGHSVYLFMYAENGTSVSAYILTVYASDGGSLKNISITATATT